MDIKLITINVNALGPISKISHRFKKVNLVYGKNEQGKTYIVDYLLSSLFKGQTSTRPLPQTGSILVDGINPDLTNFSPKTKTKIEEFIFLNDIVNHPDLARLSVVKGGDLSFEVDSKNSLPLDSIKNYLSDQRTFDRIARNLESKSALTCRVVNGKLETGKDIGLVKTYNSQLRDLQNLDNHINKINNDSSALSILVNNKELAKLDKEINNQLMAKRHLALVLSKQIEEVELQAKQFPEGVIENGRNLLKEIDSAEGSLSSLNKKLDEAKKSYADLNWLIQAEIAYSNVSFSSKVQNSTLVLAMILLGIIGAIGFAFANIPWASLVAGIFVIGILFYYEKTSKISDEDKKAGFEMDRILSELGQRLKQDNPSIITLRDALKKQQSAKDKAEITADMVDQIKQTLSKKQSELRDLQHNLFPFTGHLPLTFNQLHEFDQQRIALETKQSRLRYELSTLGIAQHEYLAEQSGVVFDSHHLEKMNIDQRELGEQIERDQRNSQTITHEAAGAVGLPVTSTLEEIFEGLRAKREFLENELKNARADIFAMLRVKDALDQHQNNEMALIQSTLSSTSCGHFLQMITKIYTSIAIEQNKVVVHSEAQSYQLEELSTGTQEQVLLAVRLGLLNHVLKGRKSFLILDDAFQHSDWDRRENLIDVLASLAHDGWQILYFTMDDHIRDLFEKKLKPQFAEEYQLIDLGAI